MSDRGENLDGGMHSRFCAHCGASGVCLTGKSRTRYKPFCNPDCEVNYLLDTIEAQKAENKELVEAMRELHSSKLPYKDESGIIEVTLGAWGKFIRAIPNKHTATTGDDTNDRPAQ